MTETIAGVPPSAAIDTTLDRAMRDCRECWRDLAVTAADFVYETDASGRFVAVLPDPAMGWSAAMLIGKSAESLLAETAGGDGFDPFHITKPVRRRSTWLRRADGSEVMLAVSAVPLLDAEGRIVGTRGIGVDWSEFEGCTGRVTASMHRGEVLDHILWRMGQEVQASRMMQAALDALVSTLGAEGAGVIDVHDDEGALLVHQAGEGANEVLAQAAVLLASATGPTEATTTKGRPLLVAACRTRFGANAGIALWRSPGSRNWHAEDHLLVGAAAALIRMVLEHEAIQHEMARQARTDPLTGLLNRRAILEQMGRHIDRLDREEQPGTLLFADLDYFKPVNDQLGHEVGDQVLIRAASMLRDAVRPTDLVARLGGDEFALWMNGADHMTAAERADHLCTEVPVALCEIACDGLVTPTMSIGIATREAGSHEPVDSLLRRADQAMYEVKRTGRGHWRVAAPEPL